MTAAKEQIEYELNEFFASALGDVFKSCRLADSASDYQISTVSYPTEKNAWLELGELPVSIELSNGRRFEISASEWLQITPL